jgi:ankyrin repeat protein
MALFVNLPLDLQRLVCFFLVHKDIKKLNPKFYEDEDDVYWKEKVSTVTDKKTPRGASHREYYEYFLYEKYLQDKYWDEELTKKMVDDEVFLTRHIDAQDMSGSSALTRAALFSDEIFIKLLSYRANVNHQDKYGYTPLMCVGCRKNIKKKEHIKLLLNMGANVNHQNSNDSTVLVMACQDSEEEIVQLLIEAGADVNVQNQHGVSPLMNAIYRRKEEMVKILLTAGADVNHKNENFRTALMIAVIESKPGIVKLLLEAGANVNLHDKFGKTAFSYANDEIKKLLSSKV